MTPAQKELITQSFEALKPNAEQAAARFYEKLFELDPALRPLFQGDMRKQQKKLMDMLAVAVSSLERLDMLVPALWQLGKRHGGYGVQDAHYATVGGALIWTLETELGPVVFTDKHKQAWSEVYDMIATVMKQAAAEGIIERRQSEAPV